MWRSFFLAAGVFAIILGGQSLLVDQIVTTNHRLLPNFISNFRNSAQTVVAPVQDFVAPGSAVQTFDPNRGLNGVVGVNPIGGNAPAAQPQWNQNSRPDFNRNRNRNSLVGAQFPGRNNTSLFNSNYSPGPNTNSSGPFNNRAARLPGNGPGINIGQPPLQGQLGQAQRPAFSQAGYNSSFVPGYAPRPRAGANRPVIKRIIPTQDWWPWSLIAVGAITVMYTYSFPRNRDVE